MTRWDRTEVDNDAVAMLTAVVNQDEEALATLTRDLTHDLDGLRALRLIGTLASLVIEEMEIRCSVLNDAADESLHSSPQREIQRLAISLANRRAAHE